MTGIVLNQARNRLKQIRNRSRHEGVSLDDPVETREGSVSRKRPRKIAPRPKRWRRRKQPGWSRIASMPRPDFREVVVLREIQGYSYEEIRDI